MRKPWMMFIAVVLVVLLILPGVGCSTGTIRADAIDGLLEKVGKRHDEYVRKDTTLTEGQRADFLRSTELLRKVVDEAKK